MQYEKVFKRFVSMKIIYNIIDLHYYPTKIFTSFRKNRIELHDLAPRICPFAGWVLAYSGYEIDCMSALYTNYFGD